MTIDNSITPSSGDVFADLNVTPTASALETVGYISRAYLSKKYGDWSDIFRSVRVPENFEPVVTRANAEAYAAGLVARIAELEDELDRVNVGALALVTKKRELEATIAGKDRQIAAFKAYQQEAEGEKELLMYKAETAEAELAKVREALEYVTIHAPQVLSDYLKSRSALKPGDV